MICGKQVPLPSNRSRQERQLNTSLTGPMSPICRISPIRPIENRFDVKVHPSLIEFDKLRVFELSSFRDKFLIFDSRNGSSLKSFKQLR